MKSGWHGLGWLLIAIAIVLLGMDLLVSLERGGATILSLGESWRLLCPQNPPATWLAGPLRLPGFAPFALVGLILLLRRPRKRRGIFTR